MRALAIVAVLLPGLAVTAQAQHVGQFEVGGFAAYTRYDRAFRLQNRLGGGVRLGYFIGPKWGLEIEGLAQVPSLDPSFGTTGSTTFLVTSASLTYNLSRGGFDIYGVGGYSMQTLGDSALFGFTDHGIHGGLGARIYLSERLALRLEGRGIYTPWTQGPRAPWAGHVVGTAGISVFAAKPRQTSGVFSGWRRQWYWGGQGTAMFYRTNVQGLVFDPGLGGHWLITGERSALYLAYDQFFLLADAPACVLVRGQSSTSCGADAREVDFNAVRRVTAGLLAFPVDAYLQPYAGIGFALTQVLDPTFPATELFTTTDEFADASEAANSAATRPFGVLIVGAQLNVGKMALFGHWMLTTPAGGFLIDGSTHNFSGGVRYSFGSSVEDVTRR